jgi:hypothetical protein
MEPNESINAALVCLHRSLAQYATECWPWAESRAADDQQLIADVAREQQTHVARLAALLDARQATVDFGQYPDWSALHYVSVDFLIGRITANEREIVAALEQLDAALRDDDLAQSVVRAALDAERRHLALLQARAARPITATA